VALGRGRSRVLRPPLSAPAGQGRHRRRHASCGRPHRAALVCRPGRPQRRRRLRAGLLGRHGGRRRFAGPGGRRGCGGRRHERPGPRARRAHQRAADRRRHHAEARHHPDRPKINSLYAYAERHEDRFPHGPERALEDAIGALLDVPIHYYARVDFDGFIDIIDAVGGVDVKVKRGFSDPDYDGIGLDERGFTIEPGRHHLSGAEALAYARVRKAVGQTDFSRAARQQQILVALKNKLTSDGSIFWSLPQLLDAVGGTVTTDIPIERLPDVALVVDEMGKDAITRVVIQRPLVKPKNTRYGASQVPKLKAIRAMAKGLFSEPGSDPLPWPTPKPTEPPSEAP
jgi:LCP family protein required for cell wall assembly